MKSIIKIIISVLVGVLIAYFTFNIQDEDLVYSITSPAKFGNINYQNITITNKGLNPAVNIHIYIDDSNINFSNVQSKTTIYSLSQEKNGIARLDRIRRNESVILSLAYNGQPISGKDIKIDSDRSVAVQIGNENQGYLPQWIILLFSTLGAFSLIGVLAAIIIPATKAYKAEKEKHEASMNNETEAN